METSWLIERLDNPALLKKGDEQRLRELIASYPYFSAPYLLLARSLHEQKHPAFEQLLPLISLQAFDRKRLFRLIHEETMDHRPWTIAEGEREAVPEAGESTVDGQRSREGDEEIKEIVDVGAEHFLPEPEVVTNSESPTATPRFAVNFNEIERTTEEPVQTVHEELQEIPFLLTMDHGPWTIAAEEEREAVPAAGAESEAEVKEMRGLGDEEVGRLGDLETVGRGDKENDLDRHKEHEPVLSLPKESATDETEAPDEESPNHKSQIINHKSDRIDFIHWLEKLQPVKKDEAVRGLGDEGIGRLGDEETRREGEEENEIPSHPEQANVITALEVTPRRVEGPDPNALIDKFIETNPSVSRVKERFYDPAVQARESERLDDNLMTETLARIFVKQEKYERAIDAYRKLQLKYPEKSDYFAALISEINSKIN